MPIINWLLYQHCSEIAVESSWADLSRLREPTRTLGNRILVALDLYPCDLLFVHRDAENEKLNLHQCAFLVSQYIDDYSALRFLTAFQSLETELVATLVANGWKAEN